MSRLMPPSSTGCCSASAGTAEEKDAGHRCDHLEANAALRSIVRRDSGGTTFLKGLAQASSKRRPAKSQCSLDRKRKKKGSNQEWKHPHDPDGITKMKDGRTHLAHKAEHAVDLETGAIVAVTVQGHQGDTTTMVPTLIEAAENLEQVMPRSNQGGGGR